MNIRYADINDAVPIAENNVLLAQESEGLSVDFNTVLNGVKAVLSDKTKGFYVVVEDLNSIIGQLMITFEWSDWNNKNVWWLQSVYIKKSWRRKKIFSQLLDHVKDIACIHNVDTLRLYVYNDNIKAIETYLARGMKKKSYSIFQLLIEK